MAPCFAASVWPNVKVPRRRFALRDCLLTFNFGNERTQRADIVTRLLGERSLKTVSTTVIRSSRKKETRLYIRIAQISKKLSSLTIDSSEIVVTFPRIESDSESDNFFLVSSFYNFFGLGTRRTWNTHPKNPLSHGFEKSMDSLETRTEFRRIFVCHLSRVHILSTSVFAACTHVDA